MITPLTGLNQTRPNLIGSCAKICLQTDEATTGGCTNHSITIQILLTGNNVTGETFTIAGQEFTVDNSLTIPTGYSMPWNQGTITGIRDALYNMLRKNFIIGQSVTFTLTADSVQLDWINCGNIGYSFNGFADLTNQPVISASTVGTNFVKVPGYGLIYRVNEVFGLTNRVPICGSKPLTPLIDSLGVGKNCVDIKSTIQPLLKAGVPTCSTTVTLIPDFIKGFALWYGSVQSAGCGNQFNTFNYTPTYKFAFSLNQAEATGQDDFLPYAFNNFADLQTSKKIKLITNKPRSILTCLSLCEVQNIYLNLDEICSLTPGDTTYSLWIQHIYDGVPFLPIDPVDVWTGDGVYQLPSGGANLPIAPLPGQRYSYKISVFASNTPMTDRRIAESEEILYLDTCSCEAAVYFLGDMGCWEVMPSARAQAEDIDVTADTLCLDSDCYSGQRDSSTVVSSGGRNLTNLESDKLLTYETIGMDKSETNRNFLEQFLRSPVHMIKYANYPDTLGFRKIILTPGTYRIRETDEKINTPFSFTYNTKFKTRDYVL